MQELQEESWKEFVEKSRIRIIEGIPEKVHEGILAKFSWMQTEFLEKSAWKKTQQEFPGESGKESLEKF